MKTVELVDEELERLTDLKNEIEQVESRRLDCSEVAALIPQREVLDRLLRYMSHLNREIEQVLSQLERFQRLRRGLPSVPTIKLTRG
jgi:hypothetical protein